jgi:hypothetical protein
MKGWYAKHKGQWHKINDIVDSGKPAHEGGGNHYHLEGIDKPVHQDEIEDAAPPSDVKKYDRVEVTADGKRELDYGVEPLDKKPLKKKWDKVKKALDESSFMDIDKELGEDEEEQEQEQVDPSENMDTQAEGEQEESVDQPQEEVSDGGGTSELGQSDDISESQEEESDAGGEELEDSGSPEEALKALEDHMKEEGYSDEDIAYIIHDHSPHIPTSDEIGSNKESELAQQDIEHNARMKDVEHKQAQFDMETNSLDRDHKQRMLDLEYDKARREGELELEYKRKELEHKLKSKKDASKHKSQSLRSDARQVSEKEKKGDV